MKIFRLLDSSVCRAVALQCLVTLTFYGDREFCFRIAGHIPQVLRLAQENMDDPSVINACATIICRPVAMILCPGGDLNEINQQALESVGPLLPVFTFFIALLRNTNTTYDTYKHIIHCLLDAARNARKTYLSYQPSIAVMVAAFRSTNLDIRVCALKGAMRLHAHVSEKDDPYSNAQVIIQNIQETRRERKFSGEVLHALRAYGMSRSDVTLINECFVGYLDAMLHFTFDHDFYSLGMKLFELIGKTEFSISDRYFHGPDGKPIDMGMPFTHWLNALPQCAKAIREKGGPSRDHIANVLDLKCFLLRKQHKEARELAANALKTHPKTAFYYYVLAVASNELEEKLRWAKKGLRIQGPKVEPYVRHGLLFLSTNNASTLGFKYLDQRHKCQKEFEEAYALLKLALDDIKVFIAEAPPDNRLMTKSIQWCILLTISLKGPELSLDLREIQVRAL